MVNEEYSVKIIAFLVAIASFQALAAGEVAFENFPSPGSAIGQGTDISGFTELAGTAVSFIFWPFRVVDWFWALASFQFIPGTPEWITLPMQVIVAAASAFAIIPVMLRLFDAVGQLAPFT